MTWLTGKLNFTNFDPKPKFPTSEDKIDYSEEIGLWD